MKKIKFIFLGLMALAVTLAFTSCEASMQDSENEQLYVDSNKNYQEYDTIIQETSEKIRLNPKDVLNYSARSAAYFYKLDYDRAIADVSEAIRIDPYFNEGYLYFLRAYYYIEKGDYDHFITDFNELLKLDFINLDSFYCWCGYVYFIKEDYYSAISNLSESIRLDPNKEAAYYLRSEAYQHIGDKTKAEADFEKVKELRYVHY